jgi:hypothetical protein
MFGIGELPVPEGFRYLDVFIKGKPRHMGDDPFRSRHPGMELGRRAKIFAPFDALRGFGEAVASKDVLYENRRELSEEERTELDSRLAALKELTVNSRAARANRARVIVTYYVACSDMNSEAYGIKGRYEKISGICQKVDTDLTRTICVDGSVIFIDDICDIEGEDIAPRP